MELRAPGRRGPPVWKPAMERTEIALAPRQGSLTHACPPTTTLPRRPAAHAYAPTGTHTTIHVYTARETARRAQCVPETLLCAHPRRVAVAALAHVTAVAARGSRADRTAVGARPVLE
eukprot:5368198-Prymnesium_polylepis.3